MSGQSNAAADRSASIIRESQPSRSEPYVWPVLTVEDHVATSLRSLAIRRDIFAKKGGTWVDNPAQVMAVALQQAWVRIAELECAEQGGFWS